MKWIAAISILFIVSGCEKDEPATSSGGGTFSSLLITPAGMPEMAHPADNDYTIDRWKLGKKLFFDKRLSADNTVSCGSCHHPELAFSDNKPFSSGVHNRMGKRNTPSLANTGYLPYYTREGGVPTLEMQVLVPIQEHDEMDDNIVEISERLRDDSLYKNMSLKAYNRTLDPFVITRALSCFERTLISGNSRYDQYTSQHKKRVLNESEKRGMELFFSEKTNCSHCHGGFNFTNNTFENNGLYAQYEDPGRFRLTGREEDKNLFKTPGLRNVEVTAPYMHDGSLADLEAVIEHYNSGGANHPKKSELIKPLFLTPTEKSDLVAFLQSLTDHQFLNNKLFHE